MEVSRGFMTLCETCYAQVMVDTLTKRIVSQVRIRSLIPSLAGAPTSIVPSSTIWLAVVNTRVIAFRLAHKRICSALSICSCCTLKSARCRYPKG